MKAEEEISVCVDHLKKGNVIVYPTDTIWGLGCDATNTEAVRKIYDIKKRPDAKAMIVLIHEIGQLHDYVVNVPEIAWDLVEFAERPLTVIYPKGKNVSPDLLGEDGSIAIRLVRSDFCNSLLKKFRKPIVSTSANMSGAPSPLKFADIDEMVLKQADYVVGVKYGENMTSAPSTIVKLGLNGEIKFIRR
jgi:L-threonylcarbamoyladenylate synthase